LKRLFALLVLLAIAAAGLYYWRAAPAPPIRIDGVDLDRLRVPDTLPKSLEAVKDRLDDERLALQVKLALSLNRRLNDLDLEVEVRQGEARLSGRVETPEQKELALSVARDVPGVSSVTDSLHVRRRNPESP
jgi:hypothetical protein